MSKPTINEQAAIIAQSIRDLGPGHSVGVVCDNYKTDSMIAAIKSFCPQAVLLVRVPGPVANVDTLKFTFQEQAN